MATIQLVASGDLRESANLQCWPAQQAMEDRLAAVLAGMGHSLVLGHPVKPQGHSFMASQREGMDVFAGLDPEAPLIVAEAVWQYSHHVLPGLIRHRGMGGVGPLVKESQADFSPTMAAETLEEDHG